MSGGLRIPGVGRLREASRVRRRDRGLRLGRPEDVAAAWGSAVTDLTVADSTAATGARRLLVLDKVGGTEDVLAALGGRGRIPLRAATLPRREVKAVFRAVVGSGHGRLTDTDYRLDDDELAEGKARYRAFLASVMTRLRDDLGLAGLVSANATYYAERELAGACEEIGLPFLVLHKESIRSPRQREAFTRAYRELIGPFSGRSVAVYNRSERDSQVAGGVVSEAAIVGCPRIDALHALRRARSHGDSVRGGPVVLFAVDPGAGTWTPYDSTVDLGAPRWEELARATERAFVDTARRRPDRDFVIKAKVGHGERLLARLPGGLPHNVSVITDGTATGLLTHASALVAFNTTVVAEGLAAGVPVVVPAYAEAGELGAEAWCYPVGPAVERVARADELPTALLEAAERPSSVDTDLDPSTRAVLDDLVGNSDGRAGQRTWDWFAQHLAG